MQASKEAVSGFLSGSGQQRTDVDETVNPAVTQETVKPSRHEETTEAIDRETHQHHYHTTVQPVAHQETLPEQHVHQVAPQVEKSFQHGNPDEERARVERELGQFQSTSAVAPTTMSASAATVGGEHTHHHVHETVQPVIHKETLAPEVVHTTIPIHEKHIAPSEHHGMSTLPTKTLGEFQQMAGSTESAGTAMPQVLQSGSHSREEYEGHPRQYDQSLMAKPAPVDREPEKHDGMHDPEKTGHFSDSGDGSTGIATGRALPVAAANEFGSGMSAGNSLGGPGAGGAGMTESSNVGGYGSTTVAPVPVRDRGTADAYDLVTSGAPATGGTTIIDTTAREAIPANETVRESRDDKSVPEESTRESRDRVPVAESKDSSAHTGDAAAAAGTGVAANTGAHEASDQHGASNRDESKEPSNLRAKKDDNVQHASEEGEDPSMLTDKSTSGGKLTGTGVDGSHSAVFGLTPDGHKYNDTEHGQKSSSGTSEKMPKREEEEKAAKGEGESTAGVGGDTGSRGAGNAAGVAEQMHDPKVADKGHEGKASYGSDDNKPVGAGTDTSKIV